MNEGPSTSHTVNASHTDYFSLCVRIVKLSICGFFVLNCSIYPGFQWRLDVVAGYMGVELLDYY